MREIKLRAWDRKRNEWYGASNPESLTFIGFSVFGECTLLCTPSVEDLMHLEITQYIGLKSKNGTEIYSGDIISDGGDMVRLPVKVGTYNIGCNGYEYDFSVHGFYVECERTYEAMINGRCEVLGNIYEHSYLLD